jgi:Na+-transporting NADH:ubiquinone oxidoreductase subunit NqrC
MTDVDQPDEKKSIVRKMANSLHDSPSTDLDHNTQSQLPARKNWLLIALLVLVSLQVLFSGYQTVLSQIRYQQEINHRNQVITSVATYTANLDALTTQMLDDYKENVYNNSNVDTTAKQQVLGTEYNFNAIMLLIKQNSRLMEVLAQMK